MSAKKKTKKSRIKGTISERKLEERKKMSFEDDFGEVPFGQRGDRDKLYDDHHTPNENVTTDKSII